MRKVSLSVVGIFLLCFRGWAQSPSSDDYKNLSLKVEDVNIVSGYYSQTGNHSAVTGGIGTQQLTDVSNTIDLKLVNYDVFNRKYSYNIELGIDHHTAASSAYVSTTGASKMGGTRIYPSFNWQVENNEKRTTFGLGASYSGEYTYHSFGLNVLFAKKSRDDNREFTAKGNLFLDAVKMVEPSELRPATNQIVLTSASGGDDRSEKSLIPSSSRNTFDASFSLSQVVNKRMQISLLTDAVVQQGYLGLPFYRVYFNDGSVHIENLPDFRFKLPLGMRMNYFLGDRIVLKSYYRFFMDNWGVQSHTVSFEVPYKITPFVSLSPFYRFYKQTAANFFAPYQEHTVNDQYYSSDYDYAPFTSHYEGINLRLAPTNGILGAKGFSALELRYGHYRQTTGLLANNITMNLTFK
ncbi:MAG: DUF3570 domain-containing protein [Flavisolibacter sp.]